MFEGFLNFLNNFKEFLAPFTVVQHWERGVLLRLGKPIRDLEPGFHWLIPFGIDDAITETVVPNSMQTSTQTLWTKDGKRVNVSMCAVYEIKNPRKFLLEVEGRGAFITDCVISAMSKHVRNTNLEDLITEESCQAVYKQARAKAFRYGVEITSLDYADCAPGSALRVFNSAE